MLHFNYRQFFTQGRRTHALHLLWIFGRFIEPAVFEPHPRDRLPKNRLKDTTSAEEAKNLKLLFGILLKESNPKLTSARLGFRFRFDFAFKRNPRIGSQIAGTSSFSLKTSL